MNPSTAVDEPMDWGSANQRLVVAELALMRARLEDRLLTPGDDRSGLRDRSDLERDLADAASAAAPATPVLDRLCAALGLSVFERGILVMCAGVELDSTFASVCRQAQDTAAGAVTFSLALAALPDAHWSALGPSAPLRRWRLVEVGTGDTLVTSPLRIDEWALHAIAGSGHLDDRLHGLIGSVEPPMHVLPSQIEVAARISRRWLEEDASPAAVWLTGDARAAKRAVASVACGDVGLTLFVLRGADVPHGAAEREGLATLWEREALLGHGTLLVELEDDETAETSRAVAAFVDRVRTPLLVSAREPATTTRAVAVRIDVERPTRPEQRALWRAALGSLGEAMDGRIERLVAQFHLEADEIDSVAGQVTDDPDLDPDAAESRLWEICRSRSRSRLDGLAQRIAPTATWEDLVLPAQQLSTLREIAIHARNRTRVYEEWGFGAGGQRGLGISALFAGASGTGKTLAAEVIAYELRLDLYRIDLSQVVSKYIGETEKNLRRVFDLAEEAGAVLLFDEADALFGKRSEVKDSHDRYANIEVSYLLQRMEAYRGLAILTTNLKSALDTAFLRRLRFVVGFPFPDADLRADIWRRVFPAATPTQGLKPEILARLSLPGGNIRNIALGAAFLAAEADRPVAMAHLREAARSEFLKLERPLSENEIGGWA